MQLLKWLKENWSDRSEWLETILCIGGFCLWLYIIFTANSLWALKFIIFVFSIIFIDNIDNIAKLTRMEKEEDDRKNIFL